jgi:hypothetical protein
MAGALGLDARTRPEAFPIKANDYSSMWLLTAANLGR